ncbi:MAG TPA: SulP family inorganic anion transporter [Anaerolineales bacterium]|nr:SulP family inorganic anion transporter [Anaerolineales bacterium]
MSRQLNFRELVPVMSIGLIGGVIVLPLTISFALLIFSSEGLTSFVSAGIGMVMFGALIMQVIIGLTSSVPGMFGGPQDSPAAILGLTALAIGAHMGDASAEMKFATVVMTVILTSVISGLFFVLIGGFKLSRLVRFIPYPVVGGFVAGTGLLLTQGALGVMLGSTPGMSNLGILLQPENIVLWVPGFLFGASVLIASRRSTHILTYPALLLAAVIVFYLGIWISGYNLEEAREMGWLLGPFPQGTLLKPLDLSLLAQVDWNLIASQLTNIFAVAIISLVALLLNASALELIAQKDVDLNRELISTGIANVAGGLAGGSVGYHYLGISSLAFRMGISNRLVPIFGASVTGLALLFGASLLSFIPKMMAGGLILFVGLSFLTEWLYDAWFQLPRVDYALVWVILIVVGAVGFLEGVGTGIAIAIILFVVNYSRIGIVKDTLTGKSYQSNVERPFEQRQLIKESGDRILILRLQGFIFFGTSQSLVSQVSARVKDSAQDKLRFLILDFHHVSALDASALFGFVRLKQMAAAHQFHLVLTEADKDIRSRLARNGIDEQEDMIRIFPTMDYGMEWCESKLLLEEGGSSIIRAGSLRGQLRKLLPAPEQVEKFMDYLEREEGQQYHILINQGDPPDCMYFIDSGEVTTRLEMSRGKFIRLKSQRGGTMVGEMGLFLKQPRTATVVVSEPSVLYRLSLESYERMMHDDPELSFHLHQWIGRVLATRITENNSTLEVLLN